MPIKPLCLVQRQERIIIIPIQNLRSSSNVYVIKLLLDAIISNRMLKYEVLKVCCKNAEKILVSLSVQKVKIKMRWARRPTFPHYLVFMQKQ